MGAHFGTRTGTAKYLNSSEKLLEVVKDLLNTNQVELDED